MTSPLAVAFFLIAALYASVGFGGGSGYLAAMSLVGAAPDTMKVTALTLNILVASIGAWKFGRAGHFSGRLFWPIAIISIPFAFWGGRTTLPVTVYKPLIGLILLYAAWRLWRTSRGASLPASRPLPVWIALLAGAIIGWLSGAAGLGGGIFLSPLILLAGWATTREAMGISAAFVLVNSAAGLLGYLSQAPTLPSGILVWIGAAMVGGWIGAEFGSKRLNPLLLQRILALVLAVGGIKMIIG